MGKWVRMGCERVRVSCGKVRVSQVDCEEWGFVVLWLGVFDDHDEGCDERGRMAHESLVSGALGEIGRLRWLLGSQREVWFLV